jgi:outer membrane protein assembly factor BamB
MVSTLTFGAPKSYDKTMKTSVSALALALVVAGVNIAPTFAADWPLFGYDSARSGYNGSERTLSPANVRRLREQWQTSFGNVADSTPILLSQVRFGHVLRSMLFQTATNGVTFGIDAHTGKILWRFVTQGPNITPSTPAADPSGQAIYAPGVDGFVHKLDAATGHELRAPGFPARITMMPQSEKDASPLNVANGYLYAVTSGYLGDAPPYDGHVVSVRLSDGVKRVFNSLCSKDRELPTPTSCSSQRSGIWSRGGAVVDPDPLFHGRVYVATGNGDFDANAGGDNYGDSIIALTGDTLKTLNTYTPLNFSSLDTNDVDLGSTSPVPLPRQPASHTPFMMAQGGKDQILRLVDRAPLPGVAHELQRIHLPSLVYSTPAVWTDGSKHAWVFVVLPSVVDAFRLETDGNGRSRLVGIWEAHPGQTGGEGTSPVVANGMVFVAYDRALVALSAVNGHTLWSSALPSAKRTIGAVHWESPIVVNGWVYCSDESGDLTAYALP